MSKEIEPWRSNAIAALGLATEELKRAIIEIGKGRLNSVLLSGLNEMYAAQVETLVFLKGGGR